MLKKLLLNLGGVHFCFIQAFSFKWFLKKLVHCVYKLYMIIKDFSLNLSGDLLCFDMYKRI